MGSATRLIIILIVLVLGINLLLFIVYLGPGRNLFRKKEQAIPVTTVNTAKPFSVLKLTPAAFGNTFNSPVMNPASRTALYTVSGRITGYINTPNKDGYLIKILKENGQFLEETPLVPINLKPVIVSGKGAEKEVDFSEIKNNEFAIISLNINIDKKKVIVSGIRISR